MTAAQVRTDLAWIDDFTASIRPYVRVRLEDRLLILVPNEVYKLNPTGLAVLKHLLDGGTIAEVIARCDGNDQQLLSIHEFFCDLHALMRGCLGEGYGRRSVNVVPFEQPFNVLPVLSEIALTYRCNLRCSFCYAGCSCTAGQTNTAEMSTSQVKRTIDIISEEAQVPSVSFTGGEPTLRDDLPDLVVYARARRMRVNLITNGTTATENLVKKLTEAGLNSVQVSLEGGSSEVHDGLTRVAGSFARTLRGIDLYRKAGFHVHTNTTVSRGNAGDLDNLVSLVSSIGLDKLSMNMIIPTGSAGRSHDLGLRYTDIGPVVLRLKDRASGLGLKFLWYSPTPMCIFNPVAEGLGNKSCAACDGLLSVAPDGGVLPCSSYFRSVGNILKTRFRRLWSSRAARYFNRKKFLPRACKGCQHVDACAGGCPLYWDHYGFSELEEARRNHVTASDRRT